MISRIEATHARSYTYPRTQIEAFDEIDMAKRKTGFVSKGKLKSNNGRNYYHVYLWPDQESYEKAAEVEKQDTLAVCVTDTYVSEETGKPLVHPKLGEIHFVSGTWDVNTVAHEVQHGILHRMRYLHPTPAMVLDEMSETYDQNDEEVIAYEAGSWVEACMAWLTNTDPKSPYPKHLFDR